MSSTDGGITRVIACAVFRPAVEHLRLERRYPQLRFTYLPADLHLRPQELRRHLGEEFAAARGRGEHIVCLYGECFPGIDEFCREQSVTRVPGYYCYEMLLGAERFRQLIEEMAGTYFAERELILHFEEYCVRPLELDDEEMRRQCFEHYRRLLYVRQPGDTNLEPRAGEMADFLELSLDISDADYSHLERRIIDSL